MITKIVKIGNSQGIRIPKILLEQSGLQDEVELEARDNQLIIRAKQQPRHGWAEAFRQMAEAGDDQLLDGEAPQSQSEWDNEEWEW